MRSLCITGVPGIDFDRVSALLFESGLATAKPVMRESTITFTDWHARAVPALERQQTPGRLWEQLAGDLLLANLHEPQWGWADPTSLPALPFWAELEPNLQFLLLTSEPQDYLAYRLLQSSDSAEVSEAECLQYWQELNERLLSFYLAYPERCVLVEARQAHSNPAALADILAQRCGLELDTTRPQLPTLPDSSRHAAPLALARYVADRALAEHGKTLKPLHDELQAARLPLAEPDQQEDEGGNLLGTANLSLASILKDYQQRCAQDLSANEREALERLKQQNQRLLDQLQQAHEEKRVALLEHQQSEETRADIEQAARRAAAERDTLKQQLEQMESAKQQAQEAAQRQISEHEETKQEAELLLLQLHQVQEELESTFLKQQALEKQHEEHSNQLKAIQAERNNLQQQNAQNAQALKAVTQERDQARQQQQALKKQLEQAESAKQQARESAQRQASELEDTKQEAELLLLQLHQVQEELEHYFLQHQKLHQQNTELEQRWQRLMSRHPDLLDVRELTSHQEGAHKRHWQANDIMIGGRQLDSLSVTTQQHDHGINLYLPAEYLETPLSTDILALEAPLTQTSWQQLQQLTSRDWKLVTQLPRLLQTGVRKLSEEEHATLSYSLTAWQQALGQLPAVLRVDNVTLRNEQLNPDYEHLWLELEGITLGDDTHDCWSVRLASNDPQADGLGQHFKLEVPEQTQEWLSSWFAESEDDFGARWELRFALPDAMDMSVWQRLAQQDQDKLKGLVAQLPGLLKRLAGQQHHQLSRSWEQWQQLAENTRRILYQYG